MKKIEVGCYRNKINDFLGVWLLLGVVWLSLGVAYIPVNKIYQQGVVVLLYFPSLLLIWRNFKSFLRLFTCEPILFGLLLMILIYAVINSVVRGEINLVKHPVYVGLFIVSGAWLALNDWLSNHSRRAWLVIIIGVGFLCALSIGLFIADPSKTLLSRMIGVLQINHVILGSYYIAFFAVVSTILVIERKKYILLLPIALMVLFILFAHSRGAYAALVVCFAAYYIFLVRKTTYSLLFALVFVLAVVAIAGVFIDAILDKGLSYRPEIIKAAFMLALEKPWFGHGLDADYWIYIENSTERFWHSHNLLAHLAIELGLMGLVLFVSLWCYAIYYCYINKKLLLARIAFTWLMFSSFAFQTDAASFIAQPRLEWIVCWVPLCLVVAVAALSNRNRIADDYNAV